MFAPQTLKPGSNNSMASAANTNTSMNTNLRPGIGVNPGISANPQVNTNFQGSNNYNAPSNNNQYPQPQQGSYGNNTQPQQGSYANNSVNNQSYNNNNLQSYPSSNNQSFNPPPNNAQNLAPVVGQYTLANTQPNQTTTKPTTVASMPSAKEGNRNPPPPGAKKTAPSLAPGSNFQTACSKTPTDNTRDKMIIPWDHSKKNFVYGDAEIPMQGKLTKQQVAQGMNSLSGDPSWNPVAAYEMCLIILIVWVILVIVASILIIFAWPESFGIKGYEWVVVVGGIIAIIFGVILLLCTRAYANKLSWRKRLLMFGVLDRMEQVNLKDTEYGMRPGKEGAWIEYGSRSHLGRS